MYKHQRSFKKIPDKFIYPVIELIKWRDDTNNRRKARAIQRVIDHRVMWGARARHEAIFIHVLR